MDFDLSYDIRDEGNFSHEFFNEVREIQALDFDNYVIDVNVVYSVAAGRKYFSDVFVSSEISDMVLEVLGEESFNRKETDDFEVLEFVSDVSSRLEAVQIFSGSDMYMPDITKECIWASEEEMLYKENVYDFFENQTSKLNVREIMGIGSYSREDLDDTDFENEDQAILEATKNLNGESLILTYDSDFIAPETYATPPEIAYEVSN
jgi:hypothetical protein